VTGIDSAGDPGRYRGRVTPADGISSDHLDAAGVARCVIWRDAASGLTAVLVIDDLSLGPAAGGVRTRAYPRLADALAEAAGLAQAMTRKCALAGLAAGGAKAVVLDHPGLDRPRAFARLGQFVAELGGVFRTAGDLGTTAADLAAMATTCPYVHVDERGLAEAVARGLCGCVAACAAIRGRGLAGLRVAIQGCGSIGAAAARALRAGGAVLTVADVDAARAARVAAEVEARVVAPDDLLLEDVDVVAPCAIGGVITPAVAASLRAWAVCGAANNILDSREAARVLAARGVLHVPDEVASAGAVIEGIGRSVMGFADRTPLIDGLGATARALLAEAAASGELPVVLAERWARARVAAAGARASFG
jgi:leucine dehydrogenase